MPGPALAKLAREHGFPEPSHVRWLSLAGSKDHAVTRRAFEDGYVLVTHNTTDFRGLYGREDLHVGLVTFNTAPGLMSLELQKRIFHLPRSWVAREHGARLWTLRGTRIGSSRSRGSIFPTEG